MKKSISYVLLLSLWTSLLPAGHQSATAQGFFQYDFTISLLKGEINSAENDYAPVLSPDGTLLYFTSSRKEGSTGKADHFVVPRSGTEWGPVVNAGTPLNTSSDDGSITFHPGGGFAIVAADDREGSIGKTDLYFGLMRDGNVVEVRNLGEAINSRHWEAQPSLSSDGTTLYFASDRPGGQGGTDIWMCRAIDRHPDRTPIWGPAENLGPTINTPGDERSPFIAEDGSTLFFATDEREGYGGFDLYASIIELGEWGEPVNLGPQINSDADEMFFSASAGGRSFFFASTRPGGRGKLDIHAGTPNIFTAGNYHITFNVVDSTDRPLPGVVTIADPATGDTVATFITSIGLLDYVRHLPAGRPYRVTATVPGRPPRVVDLEPGVANETRRLRLTFNTFTTAEFDLAKYNIPFFVSGYYRPNISTNLEALFALREGSLKRATYIEPFSPGSRKHREYRAYARIVDTVFGSIYRQAVDEIFPRFSQQALADDVLEIRVTGLADPQPFVGTFLENETVTFQDTTGAVHTVMPGSRITNFELSGLRAWYSAQLLDRLFGLATQEGKLEYEQLKQAGKIRLVAIGGIVANSGANYQAQRRISIEIVRRGGASELDLDTMPTR